MCKKEQSRGLFRVCKGGTECPQSAYFLVVKMKKGVDMARPIEATPELRGKYAKKFVKAAQNPKPQTTPIFDISKMQKTAKEFVGSYGTK